MFFICLGVEGVYDVTLRFGNLAFWCLMGSYTTLRHRCHILEGLVGPRSDSGAVKTYIEYGYDRGWFESWVFERRFCELNDQESREVLSSIEKRCIQY